MHNKLGTGYVCLHGTREEGDCRLCAAAESEDYAVVAFDAPARAYAVTTGRSLRVVKALQVADRGRISRILGIT